MIGSSVCSGSGTIPAHTTMWYALLIVLNLPLRLSWQVLVQFSAGVQSTRSSTEFDVSCRLIRLTIPQACAAVHALFAIERGTPFSPRVIACPEHISTHIFGSHCSTEFGIG